MFKWVKGGYRRASPSPVSGASRMNANKFRAAAAPPPGPRRTAFLPDTPQEQTFDSNSPRVSEISGGR